MRKLHPKRDRSKAQFDQILSTLGVEAIYLIGVHLHVEREIELALSHLLPHSTHVVGAEFPFLTKFRILCASWPGEPLGKKTYDAIVCLSKCRNALAHGADAEKLKANLDDLFRLFSKDENFKDLEDVRAKLTYAGGYIAGFLSGTDINRKIAVKSEAKKLPSMAKLLEKLSKDG